MKIFGFIVIVLILALGFTYKTAEVSLSNCYLDAQDEMKAELTKGTMNSVEASCNTGKVIFSNAINCMNTVKNSGLNMIFVPLIQKTQPKFNPANIRDLQNQACSAYPTSIIEKE